MNVVFAAVASVLVPIAMFACSRAATVVVRRWESRESAPTRVANVVYFLLLGLAFWSGFIVFLAFPIIDRLTDLATAVGLPSVTALVAHGLLMVVPSLASLYALLEGWRPYSRWVNPDFSRIPAFRRRAWIANLVALPVVFVGVHFLLRWESQLPGGVGWLLILGLGVFFLRSYIRYPARPLTVSRIRDPTDEERDRIEAAYDRIGETPGNVIVFRHDVDEQPRSVRVAGRGALRTLWVRDAFLEDVPDDELAAVIAAAEGRLQRRFTLTLQTVAVPILFIFAGLVLMAGVVIDDPANAAQVGGAGLLAVVLGFGLIPVVYRQTRRKVYRADEFACEAVGDEPVRSAFRQYETELAFESRDFDPAPNGYVTDPDEARGPRAFRAVPVMATRLRTIDETFPPDEPQTYVRETEETAHRGAPNPAQAPPAPRGQPPQNGHQQGAPPGQGQRPGRGQGQPPNQPPQGQPPNQAPGGQPGNQPPQGQRNRQGGQPYGPGHPQNPASQPRGQPREQDRSVDSGGYGAGHPKNQDAGGQGEPRGGHQPAEGSQENSGEYGAGHPKNPDDEGHQQGQPADRTPDESDDRDARDERR